MGRDGPEVPARQNQAEEKISRVSLILKNTMYMSETASLKHVLEERQWKSNNSLSTLYDLAESL